jgi:hypothetical protein
VSGWDEQPRQLKKFIEEDSLKLNPRIITTSDDKIWKEEYKGVSFYTDAEWSMSIVWKIKKYKSYDIRVKSKKLRDGRSRRVEIKIRR